VYPALAVVDHLLSNGLTTDQLLWIGTHGQMEETLVPRQGIPLATIAGGPIAGVSRREQVRNGALLTRSVGSAWRLLGRFRPDVLLLTGGYVNGPVALAAWLRRIPAVIFLPDVEPGSAIRRIQPLVQKIACTSADSARFLPARKLVVTGYPVRAELRAALQESQAQARRRFDLDPERFTLFVFGGSRGAQSINRAVMALVPQLPENIQVLHISGTLTWPEVERFAAGLPETLRQRYRPYPYLHEEMGAAFRSADLVVARAGASMLGECPAFGLPAILVPYPHAWRYQKVNADWLAERGAAIRLNDERLADGLLPAILAIANDPPRRQAMQSAALALDIPDAAARIAAVLTDCARQGKDTLS
jgi:UDP-N-acetylglucosamine--N-acetylmuramyl-(pentapeptide) pyrophosphoryl-undecaprenol N-acetylglucosamine transferase